MSRSPHGRRGLALVAVLLSGAAVARAAEPPPSAPRLVADIRGAAYPPADWGDAGGLVAIRDHLVFAAADPFSGREPWATRGAEAPPRRLGELCPGPCSSSPRWLASGGGLLYFVAGDPAHDERLWRTDGTSAGTLPLVDVVPGPEPEIRDDLFGPPSTYVSGVATAGGRLFFVALRPAGFELWSSDGTPGGTRALARLGGFGPRLLGTAGETALFINHDPRHGEELWSSDGTVEGTRLLADVRPGPDSGDVGQPFWTAVPFQGRLYFAADDGRHGRELWVSDGTRSGTRMVRDLLPGPASSYPQQMVAADAGIYLVTGGIGRSPALWRTDGTAAGTRRLRATFPLLDGAAALGDALVYHPNQVGGAELWIASAAASPRLLRRWPHPPGAGHLTLLAAAGGLLYFQVQDPGSGIELWRTDGTPAGTLRVTALEHGIGITPFKGGAYFAKSRPTATELWTSDGTAAGTRRFAELDVRDRSAAPAQLTAGGGSLFFAADDGEHGPEVWRSDGSRAGTVLVGDLAPPPPFGAPPRLLAALAPDRLLFTTSLTDPSYDTAEGALWVTGAAGEGAELLRPDVGQAQTPRLLGGGVLFLSLEAEEQDYAWRVRLWRSDGTAAGTALLAEVGELPRRGPQGWRLPRPELPHAAVAGGRLHFLVDGVLWRSDGTAAGTAVVEDLCGGACDRFFALAAAGDALYLGAIDFQLGGGGEALWRSDGTPQGTRLLRTLAGRSYPTLSRLTPAGNRVFFVSADARHGAELWTSDGTPSGTLLVRDLRPGPAGSHPAWLTPKGNGVFFAADGGRRGQELWWSDGTGPGTRPVRDIAPGAASSYPQELAMIEGTLFFAAFDPGHGLELWRSDGTAAGTVLVADVLPGPASSAPRSFTLSGGNLYFTAGRPRFGYELWAIDRRTAAPASAR